LAVGREKLAVGREKFAVGSWSRKLSGAMSALAIEFINFNVLLILIIQIIFQY